MLQLPCQYALTMHVRDLLDFLKNTLSLTVNQTINMFMQGLQVLLPDKWRS